MARPVKSPLFSCPQPVVLVGMMGVGKTTIGRRLAPLIDLPFHDADEAVEEAAGMKVADFFETHGEKAFRDGEARVIRRLLDGPPLVLATGGGAVLHPETRAHLRDLALTVWLRAPIPIIVDRATRRPTRPLLKTGDPTQTITRLLAERSPFYEETAALHVESQTGAHTKTVNRIVDLIRQTLDAAPNQAPVKPAQAE
ncbi:MAG: shikimate kinase [Pseudomonadota bacterium]